MGCEGIIVFSAFSKKHTIFQCFIEKLENLCVFDNFMQNNANVVSYLGFSYNPMQIY